MVYENITISDVEQVEYGEKELSKWSDKQLMKLFFDCWNQINVVECFGTKELEQ